MLLVPLSSLAAFFHFPELVTNVLFVLQNEKPPAGGPCNVAKNLRM